MTDYYAYIRVSTQKQGQKGSSLQEQRAAIESYAQRHGLTISKVFEERETAAKRGRQVFNRMLKELDRGQAIGVIIHKIDRSARNLRDWADLAELIDRGSQVHFAHESLDLNSRGGRLSADIQAVVAADFIRNLRDEVRKGFVGRLKQGYYPLPAPIGYENHGKAQPKTPHPVLASLVRQAFELYATGNYTIRTLAEELHTRGLRNRRGGRVSRNGWSTLLNNPFYTGLIRIKATGQVYEGNHEPIVPTDLFRRVQELLSGKVRRRGLRHEFVYRRTIRCRQCGLTVIAERQKGHIYYRCHTAECPRGCLREEALHDQVLHALAHLQLNSVELDALQGEVEKLCDDDGVSMKGAVDNVNLALGKIQERMGRLTDAYLDQAIDKETFEDRRGALLQERTQLRERLQNLESGEDSPGQRAQQFLERLKTLADNVSSKNHYERRDLLKSASSNLMLDGKNLVVAWQKPFGAIANRFDCTYGAPHRDTPRTLTTSKLLKLAKRGAETIASPGEGVEAKELAHRARYAQSYRQMKKINQEQENRAQ